MDGAPACHLYIATDWINQTNNSYNNLWVGGRRVSVEGFAVKKAGTGSSADLGGSSKIQVRTLKAEGEKGSMGTVMGHGWVGPKRPGKTYLEVRFFREPTASKGKQVRIPALDVVRRLISGLLKKGLEFSNRW